MKIIFKYWGGGHSIQRDVRSPDPQEVHKPTNNSVLLLLVYVYITDLRDSQEHLAGVKPPSLITGSEGTGMGFLEQQANRTIARSVSSEFD